MNIQLIETQKQIEELNGLLNRSFPVIPGTRFFDDFPVWDPDLRPDSQVKRFGIFSDDGKILSSACARLAHLHASHATIPVAVIGAVATDESVRGQGLASATVSHAMLWAEAQGAALLLLWGSEHSMYEKLGFELCGNQVRGSLLEIHGRESQHIFKEGFTREVFEFMSKRNSGLVLANSDFRWISAHQNTRWFSAWDGDHISAYAAIGRGIDLQNIVHEWGGEAGALIHLLTKISDLYPGVEVLCSPHHPLRFRVAPLGIEEFLCLAKISKPEVVAQAYGESDASLFHSAKEAFSRFPLWIWGLDAA